MYLTEVLLHFVLHIAETPRVGIIMGSDSDLPVMKDAAQILDMFGVTYEVKRELNMALIIALAIYEK